MFLERTSKHLLDFPHFADASHEFVTPCLTANNVRFGKPQAHLAAFLRRAVLDFAETLGGELPGGGDEAGDLDIGTIGALTMDLNL